MQAKKRGRADDRGEAVLKGSSPNNNNGKGGHKSHSQEVSSQRRKRIQKTVTRPFGSCVALTMTLVWEGLPQLIHLG